jgi:hypothetical protein
LTESEREAVIFRDLIAIFSLHIGNKALRFQSSKREVVIGLLWRLYYTVRSPYFARYFVF